MNKYEIIQIGNKLAKAGLITEYKPKSHSHDASNLFPQTEAQYNWLKRNYGTTANLVILYKREEVIKVCPELEGYVKQTKSGKFCRIYISL